MTEFNGYKLKPVDYKFQVGDILIRVSHGFEGEIAIVTNVNDGDVFTENPNKDDWTITPSYWRAIETLPGSQAKAGDTVYCIKNRGSCLLHDIIKVAGMLMFIHRCESCGVVN